MRPYIGPHFGPYVPFVGCCDHTWTILIRPVLLVVCSGSCELPKRQRLAKEATGCQRGDGSPNRTKATGCQRGSGLLYRVPYIGPYFPLEPLGLIYPSGPFSALKGNRVPIFLGGPLGPCKGLIGPPFGCPIFLP